MMKDRKVIRITGVLVGKRESEKVENSNIESEKVGELSFTPSHPAISGQNFAAQKSVKVSNEF
ncbi:MAG: hypothetical protein KAQ78_11705 [Candidatus Latescibacteria bacterium]|nr:hypothetical protein [Candidatus Latescibacterota bacterium]